MSVNASIEQIQLHEFTPPPILQERANLGQREKMHLRAAQELRRTHGLPFWDALFLAGIRDDGVPDSVLDAASYRSPEPEELITIPRASIVGDDWLPNGPLVAVSLIGPGRHIPMLDFRCSVSASNEANVVAIGRRLLPDGGIVLDSGHSYHLMGWHDMSDRELADFLARSLFYVPIVDRLYVAHHLLRRHCSLRVSAGGRSTGAPIVVAVF